MSEWIVSAETIDDFVDGMFSIVDKIVRCKDCRWGREACGNIECFADINMPTEYHGYEWFCPNGEKEEE